VLEWFKQLNALITKSSTLPEQIYAEIKRARESEFRLSSAMKELDNRTAEIIGEVFEDGVNLGCEKEILRVNEEESLEKHFGNFRSHLILEDDDDSGDQR